MSNNGRRKDNVVNPEELTALFKSYGEILLNAGKNLIQDPSFGENLRYYLLLTDHSDLVCGELTVETIYQSRFFYYLAFYKTYRMSREDNEGLYQLFMNLLEDRPDAVPWEILKEIENEVDLSLKWLNKETPKLLQ